MGRVGPDESQPFIFLTCSLSFSPLRFENQISLYWAGERERGGHGGGASPSAGAGSRRGAPRCVRHPEVGQRSSFSISARWVPPSRGSGSSICIVPLLFCLRVRFSRVEQLSLERRRRGEGEEEEKAEVADAEVALGLDSPYKVRSSLWILCASFFGLPKCGLIVGFVF